MSDYESDGYCYESDESESSSSFEDESTRWFSKESFSGHMHEILRFSANPHEAQSRSTCSLPFQMYMAMRESKWKRDTADTIVLKRCFVSEAESGSATNHSLLASTSKSSKCIICEADSFAEGSFWSMCCEHYLCQACWTGYVSEVSLNTLSTQIHGYYSIISCCRG